MKHLLRLGAVQWVLAVVLGAYLRVMLRTIRWESHNLACVDPVLASDSPAMALFWHGRVALCLSMAPVWWRKRSRALISPSADGEFLAIALAQNGFPAIRGSSAKRGDAAKTRSAAQAFREALTWLKGGGVLIVTPDGPRGPNEQIAPGTLQIARRSGSPVFLVGIAARPSVRLGGWDRPMFGLPFGRGITVWEGPLIAPAHAKAAEIEALAADWSERLRAATRRAEELLA